MKKYTDEFKLEVVNFYYDNPLGVREVAKKFNLPSKNYINNWEKQLIKKGLLPKDSKKIHINRGGNSSKTLKKANEKTAREKQYELKIEDLEAEIKYLRSLKELKPLLKKK